MIKVLFVTSIISPFWVEFAEAVQKYGSCDFRIAFCELDMRDRGSHWIASSGTSDNYYCIERQENIHLFLTTIKNNFLPDVVICGEIRNNYSSQSYEIMVNDGTKFGYWTEQPNKSGYIGQIVKKLYYQYILKKRPPDFLFAIGDRAADFYQNILPMQSHLAMLPYSQSLDAAFAAKRKKCSNKVCFLFSGRLIPRNSIKEMVTAFEKLAHLYPRKFTWCVSAYGPEEKWIRKAMRENNDFSELIIFDRDFDEWNDRLRPFSDANVLLVPAKHSGWGLVVPEALAAGLPVITTRYVEAARYFIEDMVNGIYVECEKESIFKALEYCVLHPEIIDMLSANTGGAAIKGDVTYVAKRFTLLMNRWFCNDCRSVGVVSK